MDEMYQRYKESAQGVSYKLPEDVSFEEGQSYMTRMYLPKEMMKKKPEVIAAFTASFKKQTENEILDLQLKLKNGELNATEKKIAEEKIADMKSMTVDDYAEMAARSAYDKIVGIDWGSSYEFLRPVTRGPLKDRVMQISDLELENLGIIENDALELFERFVRVVGADTALVERFATTRFADLYDPKLMEDISQHYEIKLRQARSPEQVKKIMADKRRELAQAKDSLGLMNEKLLMEENLVEEFQKRMDNAKTEKEKAKVVKDREKALEDFEQTFKDNMDDLAFMWDMLRGTFKATSTMDPDKAVNRGLSALRMMTYVQRMGGVVLGSLSDVGGIVARQGVVETFGRGAAPLVKNLLSKEGRATLRALKEDLPAVAVESVLALKMQAFMDMGTPYSKGQTSFENMLHGLVRKQGFVSGLNIWNDVGQTLAAVTQQTRTLRKLASDKPLTKKDIERLQSVGFSVEEIDRLKGQVRKYSKKRDGVWFANTNLWDDPKLAEKYQIAITQEMNATILTKGIGDVPKALQDPVAKTIGQFTSFGFASNTRLTASALQRGDREVVEGLGAMVALGMLSYYIRTPEARLSDDPNVWLIEGVDRSGIAFLPFWVHNYIMEPAGVGLSSITDERLRRMPAQHGAAALMGPSGGLISDTFRTSRFLVDMATGQRPSGSDINGVARMIPYNTMPIFKELLIEPAKEWVKEETNAKGK